MKYKIVTRDWKGINDRLDDVKGWCLFGAEDEIDTGGDCFAMIFSEQPVTNPTKTPQEIYDINNELMDVDEADGFTWVKDEENTIKDI